MIELQSCQSLIFAKKSDQEQLLFIEDWKK